MKPNRVLFFAFLPLISFVLTGFSYLGKSDFYLSDQIEDDSIFSDIASLPDSFRFMEMEISSHRANSHFGNNGALFLAQTYQESEDLTLRLWFDLDISRINEIPAQLDSGDKGFTLFYEEWRGGNRTFAANSYKAIIRIEAFYQGPDHIEIRQSFVITCYLYDEDRQIIDIRVLRFGRALLYQFDATEIPAGYSNEIDFTASLYIDPFLWYGLAEGLSMIDYSADSEWGDLDETGESENSNEEGDAPDNSEDPESLDPEEEGGNPDTDPANDFEDEEDGASSESGCGGSDDGGSDNPAPSEEGYQESSSGDSCQGSESGDSCGNAGGDGCKGFNPTISQPKALLKTAFQKMPFFFIFLFIFILKLLV